MARRVFFSFHYQNDIWRVNQVRKSGEFRDVTGTDTFYDNSLWEATKKKGDIALRQLVEKGLENSSVTVVLAAAEAWSRRWVRYEILKSFERGNGLMTLWIHQQRDQNGHVSRQGYNPMECLYFEISRDGRTAETQYYDGGAWRRYEQVSATKICADAKKLGKGKFSAVASQYTWSSADPQAFAKWVESSARAAGR